MPLPPSVTYERHVFQIHWTPLSPGSADSYMQAREFEITAWLPHEYDGLDLTPIVEAVAQAAGVGSHEVIRGNQIHISITFCLGGFLSAMVAARLNGSGGGSRGSGSGSTCFLHIQLLLLRSAGLWGTSQHARLPI